MPESVRVTVVDRYEQWGGPGNMLYLVVSSFCLIKVKALLICQNIAWLFKNFFFFLFLICLANHEAHYEVSLSLRKLFFVSFEKIDNNPQR